ncbi:MAG: hypothetical protein QXL28_03050 [Desulfurococcaceae archaeon]
MVNRVFLVEEFVYRVEREGYQPREEEVRRVGELLGQPTRKLEVVLNRYWQVFTKYVDKKCSSAGSQSTCIYSWKVNTPFRVFPLALHAFGTVIQFDGDRPARVLAYPFNKPLSYAKSPGISEEKCGDLVPREVSTRIDGWHLTAYYNPLLSRWIFATRYALHNMYYRKGKLVEEPLNTIANPYVIVADAIAERDGLYKALDNYRGWTFTFVLEGAEPAVTKPPYPIGVETEKYKLYLLMARDPEGRLYSWSETYKLVNYRAPELVKPRMIKELYAEVKRRLDTRSYIAYVDVGDPENPLLVELESDYYSDAMSVKYLYDAKSVAILVSEGVASDLAKLVDVNVAKRVLEVERAYRSLEELLLNAVSKNMVKEASEKLVNAVKEMGITTLHVNEVLKNLGEGNVKRVLKKVLSLVFEGRSLLSGDLLEYIERLVEALRESK